MTLALRARTGLVEKSI